MCACTICKYIILICDLCTVKIFTENGIKTALKELKKFKKAQKSLLSQEIIDVVCLFEATCIIEKKQAPFVRSISKALRVSGGYTFNLSISIIDVGQSIIDDD